MKREKQIYAEQEKEKDGGFSGDHLSILELTVFISSNGKAKEGNVEDRRRKVNWHEIKK